MYKKKCDFGFFSKGATIEHVQWINDDQIAHTQYIYWHSVGNNDQTVHSRAFSIKIVQANLRTQSANFV